VDESDQELPLREAIVAWGEPALQQALQQAIDAAPPGTDGPMIYIVGRGYEDERQDRQLAQREAIRQARGALLADFKRRLKTGELVALGWETPLKVEGRRKRISSTLWPMLELDIDNGSAKGFGLDLVDVRVRRTTGTLDLRSPPVETAPSRSGPKSMMPEIRAELIARADRNELKANVTDECRWLEQWFKAKYPNHRRPPQAKTIYNALCRLYHDLRNGKAPD
jgi:hypothetical protein